MCVRAACMVQGGFTLFAGYTITQIHCEMCETFDPDQTVVFSASIACTRIFVTLDRS